MTTEQIKGVLEQGLQADSPEETAKRSREALREAVDFIYEEAGQKVPEKATLLELLDSNVVADYVGDSDVVGALHFSRIVGMNAEHGRKVRKKDAQLAQDNVTFLYGLIEHKASGAAGSFAKPAYMTEASTRKIYIDVYLQEAGWDVLETDNLKVPGKASVEIEVQGMPNEHNVGYCDYVLYDNDGKPLAIVEAKKTSIDPAKGRHQVDLYGECMKAVYGYKPALYYTNGYEIKLIDGIYPDRKVTAYHTIDELRWMLQKRDIGDITDMEVNENITSRPYQRIAITNLCERFNERHRRGLVVMATGTGKTRLAISIVDILTRNKWVKTVLFLADRTALVNQAKRSFEKLLPSMSICELSGSGEKDYNARLMFSTYQTMINYIDAEDKVFTSGRFDLIIIDEAHRSIFNRYGSIFTYFDSMLVGLTATPKSEVNANTYNIFNCENGVPTYDYSLEEAIQEHYLVGYSVINRTSRLISEGIDIHRLTDEEQNELENMLGVELTDDLSITGSMMFKYLYNKDTCRQVLEELMTKGLRVNGGETIGKSIIFAYNHRHAQMIVDCFHEMYPSYSANTCQLVDYFVNYGEDLVIKFDQDDEFRIAVSVDMLDTGVDIPAVLNLVFFKPVKSKIKFVQMIGRGTRLCENIYGPGKHKDKFLIFDYCGNFEYFNLHGDEDSDNPQMTLTQRLYSVQLDLLHELQRLEFQMDSFASQYYKSLKETLMGDVSTLKAHSHRIQVRNEMQYVDKFCDKQMWQSLSPVDLKEIKKHIIPLLDSGLKGSEQAVAFDVIVVNIENILARTGNISTAARYTKKVMQAAQYLVTEKGTVPQVIQKGQLLLDIANGIFWAGCTLNSLEDMRMQLRDLMQFLVSQGLGKYNINISDDITDSDFVPDDTAIDIRTYRQKVIDYLAENGDNPVIAKIKNLEQITNDDLEELERILWQELGTKEEYQDETDVENLAVFVRSLTGLSQEAVNEKFGEFLKGNRFNSMQQEYVRTIINYVRENGDIHRGTLVNEEPFSNYDFTSLFGFDVKAIIQIVDLLHNSVVAA